MCVCTAPSQGGPDTHCSNARVCMGGMAWATGAWHRTLLVPGELGSRCHVDCNLVSAWSHQKRTGTLNDRLSDEVCVCVCVLRFTRAGGGQTDMADRARPNERLACFQKSSPAARDRKLTVRVLAIILLVVYQSIDAPWWPIPLPSWPRWLAYCTIHSRLHRCSCNNRHCSTNSRVGAFTSQVDRIRIRIRPRKHRGQPKPHTSCKVTREPDSTRTA